MYENAFIKIFLLIVEIIMIIKKKIFAASFICFGLGLQMPRNGTKWANSSCCTRASPRARATPPPTGTVKELWATACTAPRATKRSLPAIATWGWRLEFSTDVNESTFTTAGLHVWILPRTPSKWERCSSCHHSNVVTVDSWHSCTLGDVSCSNEPWRVWQQNKHPVLGDTNPYTNMHQVGKFAVPKHSACFFIPDPARFGILSHWQKQVEPQLSRGKRASPTFVHAREAVLQHSELVDLAELLEQGPEVLLV